jgi:hypothetical protein
VGPMRRLGVVAVAVGATLMLAGALGASVPFSMPWQDIGRGFMALLFAVAVATFAVGMNVMRAGLDVVNRREGSIRLLAGAFRSVALVSLAIGVVAACRGAGRGAAHVVTPIAAAVIASVGAMAAARALMQSLRDDAWRAR